MSGSSQRASASIKGSFYERSLDNQYEISVDESNLIDEYTDAKTALANWFSAVQEYPDSVENAGDGTEDGSGDGTEGNTGDGTTEQQ